MADTKISALTAAAALSGTEAFPVVQGGVTKKTTPEAIKTFLGTVKGNLTATAAPTAADDSAAGYAVGSRWLNTVTAEMWTARVVTPGGAVWVKEDLADHPGYISGNWYHGNIGMSLAAGSALAANAIRSIPFVLKSRVTISQLAARITTAAAAGNLQLAIYANNPLTGTPTGPALATTASQSTAATGPFTLPLLANATLEAGVYWLAANADNSTVVCQAYAAAQVVAGFLVGSPNLTDITGAATTAALVMSLGAQTFGTWPDLTGQTFTRVGANSCAIPIFKVA